MNNNHIRVSAEEAELLERFVEYEQVPSHIRTELVFEGPGCAMWAKWVGPGHVLRTTKPNDGSMEAQAERVGLCSLAESLVEKGLLRKARYGVSQNGSMIFRRVTKLPAVA